jgi:hypothetical protein
LKRGTVGEREKGKGRKRGGGQYTSNLGPEWMGIAPHIKEGFQVSKRGFRSRGGIFQAKGDYQGDCQGDCAMYLRYNANLVHIVPIVCMSC